MKLKSRKIISMALVFFMMLTILPLAPVTAHAAGEVTEVDTYEELYNAVDSGATNIKLTADINYTCPADQGPAGFILAFDSGNTVLDLNGKTLKFVNSSNTWFNRLMSFIKVSDGTLTIKNGTVSQSNANATVRGSYGPISVINSAKLVTENVNVKVSSNNGHAIYADTSATVHLKGGVIETFDDYALYCYGGVDVILDNGVFLQQNAHSGAPTSGSAQGYGSLWMDNPTSDASLTIQYATLRDGVTIESKSIIESAFDLDTHSVKINLTDVDQPIGVGSDHDKTQYFDEAYWYTGGATGENIAGHLIKTDSIGSIEYCLNVIVKAKSYVEPSVTSVTVTPASAIVNQGTSQQFTADVTADGGASEAVTWSVEYNTSTFTTVNSDGVLTVGADETANTLYVTATSVADTTKSAFAIVTVNKTGSGEGGNEDETTLTASVAQCDSPVSGTVGTAITTARVVIDVAGNNAPFAASVTSGADVSDWFTNLPKGLVAKVYSFSFGRVIIDITGTPTETADEAMEITIAADDMGDGNALAVTNNLDTAKYVIVEGSGEGGGNEDENTLTAGVSQCDSPVSGTIGTAITTARVVIDVVGNNAPFAASVTSGADVSDWFTNLPKGLVAKVYSFSFGRVIIDITGTPTETADEAMEITIAADDMGDGNALAVTNNLDTAKYVIIEGSGGEGGETPHECSAADGWQYSETEHWKICKDDTCKKVIDETKEAHHGGTATCEAQAVCEDCGQSYGVYGEHDYGTKVEAQPAVHTPTELKAAVAAHYFCDVCDTYFTKEKVETTLTALTGTAPAHSFGAWVNTDTAKHWKECSCGLKAEEAAHVYDNSKDATCNVCEYTRTISSGSSSGGGFSGSYNYPVIVGDTDDADVAVSEDYAVKGEKITITVKPDAGKQVDEVIVTDKDGKVIPVTKTGDNEYTFTMPASKVTVDVATEAADYGLRIVMQINNKNILVNGVTKVNDVAPVIVGDRTLVPIRVVTELLGGTADWDDATRTVTLKIDGKTMNMTIGKPIPGFGTSAVIMNDRTYVPVRYVMEKLGAEVEWIGATQQIVIEK